MNANIVDEETLFDVYLHGMANEYWVYLENLTFLSFFKLMEVARRTNKSVRRASFSSCPGLLSKLLPRKSPLVAAMKDNQEGRLPRLKKPFSRKVINLTIDKTRNHVQSSTFFLWHQEGYSLVGVVDTRRSHHSVTSKSTTIRKRLTRY